MKITILQTAKLDEGTARCAVGEAVQVGILLIIGKGANAKSHTYWLDTGYDINEWDNQKSEPLHIKQNDIPSWDLWIFRDYLLRLEGDEYEPEDVKKLHIKHFVFKKEKQFLKMMKEVERFERFEKINPVYREQIPEEVRMYVWRRDKGRCVKCNSDKDLEFDHIIPISKGGSNTERNIQLLCSECNKKKSNVI